MDLELFNTLSGRVEKLSPLEGRNVNIYSCGPTVYDYAHIGNFRTFIMNDILRRTLSYLGYHVRHVMNVTDIDDKMIARAAERGISCAELANEYEHYFVKDLTRLNILDVHEHPHATEHIKSMISMIEKLIATGYAYLASDGVYFEVSKSKGYGSLAHLDLDAETESRIEGAEDKKSPRDFALWKLETPEDHGNAYDASFGRGRPGWHIECSAMANETLGKTIDIHTGGVDLMFPHHTNEIAQSEAANAAPFANMWMHTEFVMIDGQKMSKSLGNHTTLQTVIERGFSPLAFRYWVLGTHYRSKANFTWEALDGAQTALKRLSGHVGEEVGLVNLKYKERFTEVVANDLDMPRALALAWEVVKDEMLSSADKTATLLDFDKVLGLGFSAKKEEVDSRVKELMNAREVARKEKDWATSDQIRDELKKLGWEILDTPQGSKATRFI